MRQARDNKLKPTEFDIGTFRILTLGRLGIEQFAASINPPQVMNLLLYCLLICHTNCKGQNGQLGVDVSR